MADGRAKTLTNSCLLWPKLFHPFLHGFSNFLWQPCSKFTKKIKHSNLLHLECLILIEATKAAWLVCFSLLDLTGPYLAVLGCTGLYWAVLGCTGLYLVVLGCTGLYWAVLGCTGLYWAVLGCTGLLLGFLHLGTNGLMNWWTDIMTYRAAFAAKNSKNKV